MCSDCSSCHPIHKKSKSAVGFPDSQEREGYVTFLCVLQEKKEDKESGGEGAEKCMR